MAAPGQDRSFFAAKLAASSVARIVLFALAVVIAVSGGPGTAQTTKPPKHVGVLANTVCPGPHSPFAPFLHHLAELGWTQGRNLIIDCVLAPPDQLGQVAAFAAELVKRRPDVLLAGNTFAARALKQATGTIPIVANAGDSVREGLVTNLARPEANLTGVADFAVDLFGKRIGLLKEILPRLARVAIILRKGGDTAFGSHELLRRLNRRRRAHPTINMCRAV